MAFSKKNSDSEPEIKDLGNRIRQMERFESELLPNGFTLTPDQFNMIISLTEFNKHPVRNFHWVKFINDVRPTNGGYNLVCDNEMAASKIFDYIGFELAQHLKTDKLATTYRGKISRYWKVPQEEGRVLSQGTKDLLAKMRQVST